MAFFEKKYCDICGEKIGLLGNRKLEDGNMCKNCAALISTYFSGRKKTSVSDMKEHLEYRENNKKEIADFNHTLTIGGKTRLLFDEEKGKFIITYFDDWKRENPDVISLSQVKDCKTDITEYQTEIKYRDKDGNELSFSPRRYQVEYDFHVIIEVDSPWFDDIFITINDRRVEIFGSIEYREMERQSEEIKKILMDKDIKPREDVEASDLGESGEKIGHEEAVLGKCPSCGAMNSSSSNKFCEFCGGSMEG